MKKAKQTTIKLLKNLAGIALTVAIAISVYKHYEEPLVITKEKEVIIETFTGVSLEKKIEELKQEVLDDLRHEEIKGHLDADLVIVFDPKDSDDIRCRKQGNVRLYCYSFGDFNFKIATVQYYYYMFNGIDLSDTEAMNIALDPEQARELAYEIIFNEVGGIWNWKNSAEKIDAGNRITFIRSLEE